MSGKNDLEQANKAVQTYVLGKDTSNDARDDAFVVQSLYETQGFDDQKEISPFVCPYDVFVALIGKMHVDNIKRNLQLKKIRTKSVRAPLKRRIKGKV